MARALCFTLLIGASSAQSLNRPETQPNQAQLSEALWVEGHVSLPPRTPKSERVQIVAQGVPFENGALHSVELDTDGSFRVAFSAETQLGTLSLFAKFLHLEPQSLRLPRSDQPIELRPTLGGRIVGQLTPAAGVPSEHLIGSLVRLTGWPKSARAPIFERSVYVDSELKFRFNGVPAPSEVDLSVQLEGCPEVEVRVANLRRGGRRSAEIHLVHGSTLRGFVLDERGQPLEGASVWAESSSATS